MKTTDEIRGLYELRKTKRAALTSLMVQVRDLYNSELSVPLPEMDKNESAAVANLLKQGVDGTAQRINSTLPDIYYPPLKPGQVKSEATAETARRANLGWWQQNDMQSVMSRRARNFVGQAMAPVVLKPNKTLRIPEWFALDPIRCYPSPTARLDSVTPDNLIVVETKPVKYLRDLFPQMAALAVNRDTETVTTLTYYDADVTVYMALGAGMDQYGQSPQGMPHVELVRAPNLAGICPAVVPSRITMDRSAGQFDGLIPMYFRQAKLDALEYIAIEQGIFPKQWLEANPQETPEIKVMADGRKGIVGIVKGGRIRDESLNPGYKTSQAIDRLAGEQRLEGNVPAEMQGVSSSNIRTGRRGDEVLSEGIDFGIQEAQRLFERSLQEENTRAVAIAKAWFGSEKHSYYVNWRGATGPVEYTPNECFVTDHNIVKYAMAGSDLNGQVVRTGQKLGAGLISKKTARRNDPEISDPDFEDHQIVVEQAEQAFLQGLSQQMASGQFNPADAARFVELVKTKKLDPIEAFQTVQTEAQARQATSGEPGTPEGPVDPNSPEAQPGVAQPGTGAEAGIPVGPPPAAIDNLRSILKNAGTVRSAERAS